MVDYIEYLNMPAKAALILIAVYLCLQFVGEFLEVKGQVVPEFMKIRKYFARKKQERETIAEVKETLADAKETLNDVKAQLQEFNVHYSADNIKMRDGWMKSVNQSLKESDEHFRELSKKLEKNSADTLAILIENKRSDIIGFASFVIDEKNPVTREQFRRVFKAHKDYEEIIAENGLTNGEVDTALRIIRESYETHMRNHSFVEDVRGYDIGV